MPFLTHNDLRLTKRALSFSRLPSAFEGLKIVQLSDLHLYEYTDWDYYERVLEQVNALAPDVIVLTGDVIHFGPHFVDRAGTLLSRLIPDDSKSWNDSPHVVQSPSFGVGRCQGEGECLKLAILGNHDYTDTAKGQHVVEMLSRVGFTVLQNENIALEKAGQRLWFAGLEDLWYGMPDFQKALSGIPTETEMTIVLAHNPLLFDPMVLSGHGRVDLMISGHTHAGHIYIPILGLIYRYIFRMKYRHGLYERAGSMLQVSSGLGSAAFYLKKRKIAFPRFRWNTNPEIVLMTLHQK